jgi:heterodisulfide reductase subunit C
MSPEVVRLSECDPGFVREVLEAGAKNATQCFSCGTCTGGCPAAFAMDYTPRQIMRMVELGMREEVFRSRTIWMCAGCHTCTARCPRGVELSKVMAVLKSLALKHGYRDPRGAAWYEAFMEVLRSRGRVFEPELLLKFNLKRTKNPVTLARSLLKDAPLGVELMRKGKLMLTPDNIKGREQLERIMRNVGVRG